MFSITALYKFARISSDRIEAIKQQIETFLETNQIKGLVLLSAEGINGTIAGTDKDIAKSKEFLQSIPEFGQIPFKDSFADFIPFKRLKVDIREEIVTLKRPDIFPEDGENHHLSPRDWHDTLMNDQDVVVIDTRNFYEVEIGKFKNAVDPKTSHFSEFPEFIKSQNYEKDKKILMYCTGGIRCEKALVHMQQEGFKNVYQLEGGILNYLKEFPEGAWEGECFIFDHRVALDSNLEPSKTYSLCPHCGNPGKEDINCQHCGEAGVVCHHCKPKPFLETCSKNCANQMLRISKKSTVAFPVTTAMKDRRMNTSRAF